MGGICISAFGKQDWGFRFHFWYVCMYVCIGFFYLYYCFMFLFCLFCFAARIGVLGSLLGLFVPRLGRICICLKYFCMLYYSLVLQFWVCEGCKLINVQGIWLVLLLLNYWFISNLKERRVCFVQLSSFLRGLILHIATIHVSSPCPGIWLHFCALNFGCGPGTLHSMLVVKVK
jgi:hypothetical protein